MCELGWILLLAQMVVNPPTIEETWVPSLGQEDPLEKGMNGYPLQYPCLENSMDRSYSPWGHKELGVTELLTLSLKY